MGEKLVESQRLVLTDKKTSERRDWLNQCRTHNSHHRRITLNISRFRPVINQTSYQLLRSVTVSHYTSVCRYFGQHFVQLFSYLNNEWNNCLAPCSWYIIWLFAYCNSILLGLSLWSRLTDQTLCGPGNPAVSINPLLLIHKILFLRLRLILLNMPFTTSVHFRRKGVGKGMHMLL